MGTILVYGADDHRMDGVLAPGGCRVDLDHWLGCWYAMASEAAMKVFTTLEDLLVFATGTAKGDFGFIARFHNVADQRRQVRDVRAVLYAHPCRVETVPAGSAGQMLNGLRA